MVGVNAVWLPRVSPKLKSAAESRAGVPACPAGQLVSLDRAISARITKHRSAWVFEFARSVWRPSEAGETPALLWN